MEAFLTWLDSAIGFVPEIITAVVAVNVALAGVAKLTPTQADDALVAKAGAYLESLLAFFLRKPRHKA